MFSGVFLECNYYIILNLRSYLQKLTFYKYVQGIVFSPPSSFGKQIRAYTYLEFLYTNYGIEKVSKEINMKCLNVFVI